MLDLKEAVKMGGDTHFVHNVRQMIATRPLGFLRVLINNNTIAKGLIDSGNLAHNLISENLARSTGCTIKSEVITLGGASTNSSVQIIGRTTISIRFEHLNKVYTLDCLVGRGLAHSLNLGYTFLSEHRAKLDFNAKTAKLILNNTSLLMQPANFNLGEPSIDKHFSHVLGNINTDQIKNFAFVNVSKQHGMIEQTVNTIDTSHCKARVMEDTLCPPNTVTKCQVSVGGVHNSVFLENDPYTDLEILPLSGIYEPENQVCTINVLNTSNKPQILNKRLVLGRFHPIRYEGEVLSVNNDKEEQAKNKINPREFVSEKLKLEDNVLLTPEQKDKLLELVIQHFACVSTGGNDLGRTELMQFKIKIKPDAVPQRARVRPLNPTQEQDLKRQITEWTDAQIIEPACGEWASALVPCKKRNSDKLRWCIDYRALNSVTIKDSYPIPHLASNLDKLRGGQVFSSLDSASAYHVIEIEESSRPYTAFTSMYGLYQFKRLPFGLCNAPSAYCRLVATALSKLPSGYAIAYLDDILVYSKSIDEHFTHLENILKMHLEVGLKLNLAKCHLFQTKVTYLGHMVSKEGIEMIPEYVQKIKDWPTPTTGAELRTFLGFVSYYRNFIERFATITADLNAVRNEKGKLDLTPAHLESIQELKNMFLVAPIRSYPDFDNPNPFILETDWSAKAIGALLKQEQGGQERLIACISRSNNKSQRNYSAWKGETLAIVYALKKFEHILSYRPFIIRTDSSFQLFLSTTKEATGMVFRWLLYLSKFTFTVVYTKGEINPADPVSRVDWPPPRDELNLNDISDDEFDVSVNTLTYLNLDKNELVFSQRTDPAIMQVMNIIQHSPKASRQRDIKQLGPTATQYVKFLNRLTIKNDLLCFVDKSGSDIQFRPCVPNSMILNVLKNAHMAHPGIGETYHKIRQSFFWPAMAADVSDFVKSCEVCCKKFKFNKSNSASHKEIIGSPNARVYLDFVGPLSPAKLNGQKYTYILTIMDHFSRYLYVYPTVDCTAQSALKGFLSFIFKFGVPISIHTDNGTHFVNKLMDMICSMLNINKTTTLTYNPTGNAYLERAHGTIKPTLRGIGSDFWLENLDSKVFFYNISKHSTTGFSPFYLFFGRLPNTPLTLLMPLKEKERNESYFEYLLKLRGQFESISKQSTQKQLGNVLGHKPHKFEVGQKVWYLQPQPSSGKLNTNWKGPFWVLDKVNDTVVRISNTEQTLLANVRNLKHFVSRKDLVKRITGETLEYSESEGEEGDELYNTAQSSLSDSEASIVSTDTESELDSMAETALPTEKSDTCSNSDSEGDGQLDIPIRDRASMSPTPRRAAAEEARGKIAEWASKKLI